MVFLASLFLFLFVFDCGADRIEGRVSQVLSGDLLVMKEGKTKHQVRLAGIMAPVKGQPYFWGSLESLRKLTGKRSLVLDWDKVEERCKNRPEKCPKVGRLLVKSKDINLLQVKRGAAWHDVRRMDEQTTPDRTRYAEAEDEARTYRRGLWKAKNPVPPWKFVANKKSD